MVRSSYASLYLGLPTAHFLLRPCIPSFARRNRWENKKIRVVLPLLPPPGPVDVAQPSRPGLPPQWRKAWAPRVFLRHSN
jgi:hypothetical protein